jgi:hypothetical protein
VLPEHAGLPLPISTRLDEDDVGVSGVPAVRSKGLFEAVVAQISL